MSTSHTHFPTLLSLLAAAALCGSAATAVTAVADDERTPLFVIDFETPRPEYSGGGGETGGKGTAHLEAGAGQDDSSALVWHYDLNTEAKPGTYSRCRIFQPLPGRPECMKIAVWGDDSNLEIACRFIDATGKTWQIPVTRIDFDGWREFEVTLDPKTAGHWGGTDRADGGFEYPLTIGEFIFEYGSPLWHAAMANHNVGSIRFDNFRFYDNPIDYEEF